MRFGFAARIGIAGALVVAFLVFRLVVVLHSFDSVRSATARQERAQRAALAATRVETLVLDLETGARGYALTRAPGFLAPWRAARAALPAAGTRLSAAAPGPGSAAIDAAWRAYLHDYSEPFVALVRAHPGRVRALAAAGAGKRRVDGIRAGVERLVREQSAVAADARTTVRRQQHATIVAGLSGIGATILLFVLVGVYFLRYGILPLRRIAGATREVAAGRPVSLPEDAPGEVGELAAAFNEMSRSLERSQQSLAEQNVDLERLANLLRAVLDATVDGILLSDRDGGVQLANRPLLRIAEELGMARGDNVVDNLLSVRDQIVDPVEFAERMERLRASADSETVDEFQLAESGRVFQGFTAPVRDLHGGFVGRIWTLREVTQQRELDRLKDEFVATVSHELRTPLTSMMGFLEMVRDGDAGTLTDDQQRFLTIVYRSSERLQRLVGDLLFVSRLDASGLQLVAGEVLLADVIQEVAESVAALARLSELELVVEAEPVPSLRGDPERLAQVASNLLSNAIKFTPPGGRVVARTLVADGHAVLEVEDTGIGVPEAEQGRLFDRFFRSSTATEQAIPGTGLGLVIAKAIVEAHEGRVLVRSELGVGTCFRVELPLERAPAAA